MSCPVCTSVKQVEFSAEMVIHRSGLKNLDAPGVWVFQKLLVCSDCGFSQFTVTEPQLAQLIPTPLSERLPMAAS